MTDFDASILEVECAQCEVKYTLPLRVVRESHELLDGECPGSRFECPANYFASLVDSRCLERLAKAWEDVERSANANNRRARLRGSLRVVLEYEEE